MISAYMTDSITLITRALSAYNEVTETTATIKAHVVWKTKTIRGAGGEDVLAVGYALVDSAAAITLESRLTTNGRTVRVVGIEEMRSFSTYCKKVWLGSAQGVV